MARIKLDYVHEFVDRYGHVRRYYRRNGRRISLKGHPGSAEFRQAYEAAHAHFEDQPAQVSRERPKAGTFNALAQEYFSSLKYLQLGSDTRRAYRGVITRLMVIIGHRYVDQMQPAHVDKLLAKFVDRPGAGTEALKKLRILLKLARRLRWIDHDPTVDTARFKSGAFHTWTEEEIAQFEARWPLGTRERTAFALHLYTGQRRSDVVKMGWPDIADGGVQVVSVDGVDEAGVDVEQQKTGEKVWIPIHLGLAEALAAWRAACDQSKRRHLAILTTHLGAPFKAAGYGNWFRDITRAAGLPERCASHGLRKAAGRRLAEAGCSSKEIAAVLGHKSLKEVERYTRAADQKRLASAAITRLSDHKRNGGWQTSPEVSGKPGKNCRQNKELKA